MWRPPEPRGLSPGTGLCLRTGRFSQCHKAGAEARIRRRQPVRLECPPPVLLCPAERRLGLFLLVTVNHGGHYLWLPARTRPNDTYLAYLAKIREVGCL